MGERAAEAARCAAPARTPGASSRPRRFSPLWQPAAEALGQALGGADRAPAWSPLLRQLASTQAEFLRGQGGRAEGDEDGDAVGELAAQGADAHVQGTTTTTGGGHSREGESPDARQASPPHRAGGRAEPSRDDDDDDHPPPSHAGSESLLAAHQRPPPSLEELWRRPDGALGDQHAGAEPQHAGSTDAANRLKHIIKAMAAAPSPAAEAVGRDWVPLLLEFAAAGAVDAGVVEAGPQSAEAGGDVGAVSEAALEERRASGAGATTSAARSASMPPGSGGKRARPAGDAAAQLAPHVGGRVYRGVLQDWLGFLAGACGRPRRRTARASAAARNVQWRDSCRSPHPPPSL